MVYGLRGLNSPAHSLQQKQKLKRGAEIAQVYAARA